MAARIRDQGTRCCRSSSGALRQDRARSPSRFPGNKRDILGRSLWAEILEEEHQRALMHGLNAGDAVNYAWDVNRGAAPDGAGVFWRIECDVSGTEHDSNPHNAMMSDNLLAFYRLRAPCSPSDCPRNGDRMRRNT